MRAKSLLRTVSGDIFKDLKIQAVGLLAVAISWGVAYIFLVNNVKVGAIIFFILGLITSAAGYIVASGSNK